MYPLRRIFQNTIFLKNYIYTSSVKCEKYEKSDKDSGSPEEKVESDIFRLVDNKAEQSSDVNKKKAHLNSDEKSTVKEKKSKKKSQQHELKNFFESGSVKKALNSAAESVAGELGENKAAVKVDLMEYLQTLKVTQEKPKKGLRNLVMSKVEADASLKSIFLNVKNLNILKNMSAFPLESQLKLHIWDNLESEELEYWRKTHPRNHFEELINWTNEGRMWKFPIDNEQGLDEEAKVPFTQHIFLEQHLEPWCPKKGPLRRFMDLVLIGLGKNPYLSVEEKKEHIKWFQDYFERKKKLLQEVGAMSSQKEIEAPGPEEKS